MERFLGARRTQAALEVGDGEARVRELRLHRAREPRAEGDERGAGGSGARGRRVAGEARGERVDSAAFVGDDRAERAAGAGVEPREAFARLREAQRRRDERG